MQGSKEEMVTGESVRGPVLVTGATGFIGRALVAALAERGVEVRAAVRRRGQRVVGAREHVVVGDMGGEVRWEEGLEGVDCVVHLAGRVHTDGTEEEFYRVNCEGTRQLVEAARRSGVRRVVYLSSLAVLDGHGSMRAVTEEVPAKPRTAYGRSKLAAERVLLDAVEEGRLEVTIVRPPLVYGPRAPGNMVRMVRLVAREVPLPLGAIKNKRSFVCIDNLVGFLILCMSHPKAEGEVFNVADDEYVSTPELARLLGQFLGVRVRLIPVPVGCLKWGATAVGLGETVRKLTESFVVSTEKAKKYLGWVPQKRLQDGLRELVAWYRSTEPRLRAQ